MPVLVKKQTYLIFRFGNRLPLFYPFVMTESSRTVGGQKPSSFPFGIIGFSKPVFVSTMEGSRIGAVRLLRNEICHKW